MNYTYTQLGLTQTYRLVDSGIFKHSMDFHVIIQHLLRLQWREREKAVYSPFQIVIVSTCSMNIIKSFPSTMLWPMANNQLAHERFKFAFQLSEDMCHGYKIRQRSHFHPHFKITPFLATNYQFQAVSSIDFDLLLFGSVVNRIFMSIGSEVELQSFFEQPESNRQIV